MPAAGQCRWRRGDGRKVVGLAMLLRPLRPATWTWLLPLRLAGGGSDDVVGAGAEVEPSVAPFKVGPPLLVASVLRVPSCS